MWKGKHHDGKHEEHHTDETDDPSHASRKRPILAVGASTTRIRPTGKELEPIHHLRPTEQCNGNPYREHGRDEFLDIVWPEHVTHHVPNLPGV